jgi:lytic murein transglycosylase
MDRRAFLLLTLAGVADPSGATLSLAEPAPTPPDAEAAVHSGNDAFDAWARDYMTRAVAAGLPADVLRREFTGLTPDPRIQVSDTRQPEFNKPTSVYIKGVVTDQRVAAARNKGAGVPQLPAIEDRYGVARQVLVSIWAVETAFGAVQGDNDVLRSLATLAAAGRRRAWAEAQINAVIKIIASGEAVRGQLKGSWAGAMGQTQFEPETFLADAVDGDGDGRRDIWGSSADALASTANLLAKAGWRTGESWQVEAVLPAGFDYSLAEGERRSPEAWAALGARRADGAPWSRADEASAAQLLLPCGAAGPAFLLFPNHFIIRKYNNSVSYALSVGLLADRIAGAAPLVTPWPTEIPLSLADRIAAQQALAKLGFDPGAADGALGANTRAAVRAWQKARGLTADGYLTIDLIGRLIGEAGAAPTPLTPAPAAAPPARPS